MQEASGLLGVKSYSLMPYFLMPSPIISSGINILRVSTRVSGESFGIPDSVEAFRDGVKQRYPDIADSLLAAAEV